MSGRCYVTCGSQSCRPRLHKFPVQVSCRDSKRHRKALLFLSFVGGKTICRLSGRLKDCSAWYRRTFLFVVGQCRSPRLKGLFIDVCQVCCYLGKGEVSKDAMEVAPTCGPLDLTGDFPNCALGCFGCEGGDFGIPPLMVLGALSSAFDQASEAVSVSRTDFVRIEGLESAQGVQILCQGVSGRQAAKANSGMNCW